MTYTITITQVLGVEHPYMAEATDDQGKIVARQRSATSPSHVKLLMEDHLVRVLGGTIESIILEQYTFSVP